MKNRFLALSISLLVASCSNSTPPLSESATARLNAPMPTSENQRIWECAGSSSAIKGLAFVLKLQGKPADSDGEIWAVQERAKRLGCSQAEMDAADQGNFSSPPVSPRPQ